MITAVDTNIILDVLIPNEPFSESSKKLLDAHLSKGRLILCEVVYAELAAQFPSEEELKLFLTETGMRLAYSNEKSLYIAGTRWAQYTKKGNRARFTCGQGGQSFEVTYPHCSVAITKRSHVLSDFLIAAHALGSADCLLSRDLGIYKTYFRDLKVVGSI
jgi:predicted nucleic acid-binding protein